LYPTYNYRNPNSLILGASIKAHLVNLSDATLDHLNYPSLVNTLILKIILRRKMHPCTTHLFQKDLLRASPPVLGPWPLKEIQWRKVKIGWFGFAKTNCRSIVPGLLLRLVKGTAHWLYTLIGPGGLLLVGPIHCSPSLALCMGLERSK
jgi:hypothetical protein